MKAIKFRSPEIAEKVHAHLYDVTRDGNKLFFTKFDQMAFNLAINLENLSRADYAAFGGEGDREGPWISRPSGVSYLQGEYSITLNIGLYLFPRSGPTLTMRDRGMTLTFSDPVYHQVRLLVCGTFRLTEEAVNEIPLTVN
ncbi:hypothetical protein QT972_24385 [Microcoleus sp. herbarium7]|uniref:hypothetical protein n=1 Tax=Microcoleus sp. herbarium7 TaxID=3055435 RepID=UPI002FD03C93